MKVKMQNHFSNIVNDWIIDVYDALVKYEKVGANSNSMPFGSFSFIKKGTNIVVTAITKIEQVPHNTKGFNAGYF